MKLNKNDVLKISGEKHQVITADQEYAVVGKVNDGATSFENTAIYANGIGLEHIVGLQEINGVTV
jgi:hypothetical protein